MKIEINMFYDRIDDSYQYKYYIKPSTSAKIDISVEEMAYVMKSNKQLFEAVIRLINFSIQFVQE